MTRAFVIMSLALIVAASSAHAVPHHINFQGILHDNVGAPVADGSYDVTFTIYTDSASGAALWTETQAVATTDGLFTIRLGDSTAIPDSALATSNAWLGIAVSPDPEMPRQRLIAVAYAYRVSSIDSALGGTITSNVSIGPGHTNTGTNAFVAGENSTATGPQSTIGGGYAHTASATAATIAGGGSNTVTGPGGTIGGGSGNQVAGQDAVVAGGAGNHADGSESAVAGGVSNQATGDRAAIGGGLLNEADHLAATIAGGSRNKARGDYSFIGGGGGALIADSNLAWGDWSVIAGGQKNNAGVLGVIGGGLENAAGFRAAVGGGFQNVASGDNATVSGGRENEASGAQSTVPGGYGNAARGGNALAAGVTAKANHTASIVLAANLSPSDSVASSANGQMVLMADAAFCMTRANGAVSIPAGHFLETSTGAFLTDAGVWTNASSRAYKTDIQPLRDHEYADVLERVNNLDVVRFRYKTNPGRRHVGLIAEDVPDDIASDDRKGIPTADAIAFLMAAVKAQQTQIRQQKEMIAELSKQVKQLTGQSR